MKIIFNKVFWVLVIGVCILFLGSCIDLSEMIYDMIVFEKYEFIEKDWVVMFVLVYSSFCDVYWGWYSYVDMMDQLFDLWCIFYWISIGWGDLYVFMYKYQFYLQIVYFNDIWNCNYVGINVCNKLLVDEVIVVDIIIFL